MHAFLSFPCSKFAFYTPIIRRDLTCLVCSPSYNVLSIVLSNHWLSVHSFVHYYLPQRSTHTGARTHNHRIHSTIQPSTTYRSSARTHIQRHVAGWRQHDTSSSPRGSPDDPARQCKCAAEFFYTQKGGGFAGTSSCSVSCCCGCGCVARHARFGAAGVCGTHTRQTARERARERG